MRIGSFDLSTKTGWSVVDVGVDGKLTPVDYGMLLLRREKVLAYGDYPDCYFSAAQEIADQVSEVLVKYPPDVIVIEETNLGKSRYDQKILEFIHCCVIARLQSQFEDIPVVYLSTSSWRTALDLRLSKDQKKQNARLSKAKREAAAVGGKVDKKKLGIKGKVTWKHIAIQFVSDTFGIELKMKDDGIADALCLACAYAKGARACDGT